jgi:hypothetical protein
MHGDRVALYAGGLAGLIGLVGYVAVMTPVWTTEIAVTNQRLVIKKGLFAHTSEELQLWSIEEVDWEQGLLDRSLDLEGSSFVAQGMRTCGCP